ncbi:MAG: hypothetical protein R3213_10520, partial [Flavobacteriaceae bacterium]|nr:hypothetical protein [Flavobacteriaceae bacterium]
MNPSANGWVAKYGKLLATTPAGYADFSEKYASLRKLGFVYGINSRTPSFLQSRLIYSTDEVAKINLTYGLYHTYKLQTADGDFSSFVTELV